jgi:hypothetical protein
VDFFAKSISAPKADAAKRNPIIVNVINPDTNPFFMHYLLLIMKMFKGFDGHRRPTTQSTARRLFSVFLLYQNGNNVKGSFNSHHQPPRSSGMRIEKKADCSRSDLAGRCGPY